MKYRLAIASIFRDSAFYLKEWIEFHLLVGVEHFYLANHLSQDHFEIVLEPYIKHGIVELLTIDKDFVKDFEKEIHMPYMNKFIEKAKKEAEWLALIDSDEFITPKIDSSLVQNKYKDSIYNILENMRTKHKKLGGVAINWVMYGHAGVNKLSNDEFILERLNKRAFFERWSTVKCIVIPTRTKAYNVHRSIYHRGFETYDMNDEVLQNDRTHTAILDRLWLTHYNIGDVLYFNQIKIPFYLRYLRDNLKSEVLYRAKTGAFNDVEDNYMAIFAIYLREKLRNQSSPSLSEKTPKDINLLHHIEDLTESKEQKQEIILYGARGIYKDITKIVIDKYLNKPIPMSDIERVKIFGDPLPNVVKHIIVMDHDGNNKELYSENKPVLIPNSLLLLNKN